MSDDTPDPMTVVKITLPEHPPSVALFCIGRRSTAARYAADAEPGEVTDLGPAALGRNLIRVGVAQGDRWLMWFLPSYPAEPVPGSPGSAASRN